MFLSNKKAVLISFVASVAILFSLVLIWVFNKDYTPKPNQPQIAFKVETKAVSASEISPTAVLPNYTNEVDVVTVELTRKMLWTLATGESKFTISSQSDLVYYANATYLEVPDYENPRVGIYLDASGGLLTPQTYTYYNKVRPVDFTLHSVLEPGVYLVELDHVDLNTGTIYGTFVEISGGTLDFSKNPYQCELVLTKDISVSYSSFKPFYNINGIFNGNGHTISFTETWTTPDTGAHGCVFDNISSNGIVCNTKFKNISARISDADYNKSAFVGGIVGYNSGVVKQCVIENIKFISDKYRTHGHCATIAGNNQGAVRDCMLLGTYKVGGDGANFLSNWDGITSFYFVVTKDIGDNSATVSKNLATDCTYNMTASKESDNSNCNEHSRLPSDTDTMPADCYMSKDAKFSSLSKSAEGGYDVSDPWYYATDYNNGWPMLRVFISGWTTINAVSANETAGTVSPASIKVPSDADSGYFDDGNGSTSVSIYILDQRIYAGSKTGYSFKKWTYNSSNKTYTATFEAQIWYVIFHPSDNTTGDFPTGYLPPEEHNDTYCYPVYEGTVITIGYETYGKTGAYKKMTFTFYDTERNTKTITYSPANNKYYISGNSLNTMSSVTVSNGVKSISVTAVLKTYNITFG